MEEFTCVKKLDGYFVASREWCFILPDDWSDFHRFQKSETILVRKWANDQMKGLDIENPENCKAYKVKIGNCGEFPVYLLLIKHDEPQQETFTSDNQMPAEKKFENSIEDVKLLSSFVNEAFPKQALAATAMNSSLQALKTMAKLKSASFIIGYLGQNCKFDTLQRQLERYFWREKIHQLIVHCAIDFTKDKCSLFFSRQKVQDYFKEQWGLWKCNPQIKRIKEPGPNKSVNTPRTEFYPCLLRGYGNFYYDLDRIELQNSNVNLVDAKFYAEPFKDFHKRKDRRNEDILKNKSMSTMIIDPRNLAPEYVGNHTNLDFLTKLTHIDYVEKQLYYYMKCVPSLSARFEVIFKFNECEAFSVLKTTTNIINKVFGIPKLSSCIEWVETKQLAEYLVFNLAPFISTLKQSLTTADTIQSERKKPYQYDYDAQTQFEELNRKRYIKAEESSQQVLSIEDYVKCIISECMLTHTIYGNIYWRDRGVGRYSKGHAREKEVYPKWLINALEVQQKHDKKITVPLANIHKQWYLGEKVERSSENSFEVKITADIKHVIEDTWKFSHLNECYKDVLVGMIDASKSDSQEILSSAKKRFASLVINTILDSVLEGFQVKSRPYGYSTLSLSKKINYMSNKFERKDDELISTEEFIQMVLNGEFSYLHFITWLCSFPRLAFKEKFHSWQYEIAATLEDGLFENAARLYLPHLSTAVAPLNGRNRMKFSQQHRILIASTNRDIIPNFVYPLTYSQFLDSVCVDSI